MAGPWDFTKFCDPAAVGTVVTVTQEGCAVRIVEWTGWTGAFMGDEGQLRLTGPRDPHPHIDCEGKAATDRVELVCRPRDRTDFPACDVLMERRKP